MAQRAEELQERDASERNDADRGDDQHSTLGSGRGLLQRRVGGLSPGVWSSARKAAAETVTASN
jgi:hypothetical protein